MFLLANSVNVYCIQDGNVSSVKQHDATDSEGLTEAIRRRRGHLLDRVEHKTEVHIGLCS